MIQTICICKYKQNKLFRLSHNNIKLFIIKQNYTYKMEQNREIRSIARAFTTNGRTVSGYAIRFNEDSAFMGFTERINPSALPASMLENADMFAYFNHDWSKVLARTPN